MASINSKMVLTWLSNKDKIKKFLMEWSHIFYEAKLYRYTNVDFSLYRIDSLSLYFRSFGVNGEKIFLTYETYYRSFNDLSDEPEFKVPISFFDDPQVYYDKVLERYKKDRRNYY